ncbi:MAG: GNAT family N-acetyltransferase [Proteobacteria bacterium]|nr:GNAT family N-acetyltransferase [Desulfobacteraceae bacterium]MBU4013875.1 GNAT family N-acetyltransferase [Pseudomonadota bacterium]MBU4068192.1 GNAT family N-acetyltransferase [Pseudomonadota bacterium]MBU4128238.1 GNAT family N-acetyltransferase [Pseudomonadota bacterium]
MSFAKSAHSNSIVHNSLKLREVGENDCELLWKWSNDSVVRSSAFHSSPISWEEHKKWFATKLGDSNCFYCIAIDGLGKPVGQIRFDVSDGIAETDISVAREKRGLGLGQQIIKSGLEGLCKRMFIRRVYALVKIENIASVTAFKKAGFKNEGEMMTRGCKCVYLTLAVNQNE